MHCCVSEVVRMYLCCFSRLQNIYAVFFFLLENLPLGGGQSGIFGFEGGGAKYPVTFKHRLLGESGGSSPQKILNFRCSEITSSES